MKSRTALLLIAALLPAACKGPAGYQEVYVRVIMNGAGLGRVTSTNDVVGIDCYKASTAEESCNNEFDDAGLGGTVTLVANADPGSRFDGWSGSCSGSGPVCEMTFDPGGDLTLTTTATFSLVSPGHLDLTTSTTGVDLDPDGYTAGIGARFETVPLNGTTRIADLEAGQHTVELTGAAPNCAVTSTNPVETEIVAGQTTAVRFDVLCVPTGDIVLEDDFSVGAQWTTTVTQTAHGAWQQGAQNSASGGNPDGFRRMTHTMTQTTAPDFAVLTVQHIYTGASYDPATQGAIRFIDYSEDRIEIDKPSATAEVASAFMVVQGGVAYAKSLDSFSNDAWQTATLTSLTPADFSPAPGPDFSASGAPMQFGYQRANSSRFPIVLTHGIDNWRVTVRR